MPIDERLLRPSPPASRADNQAAGQQPPAVGRNASSDGVAELDDPARTRDRDPRWLDANGDLVDEDHRGLSYDVRTLVNRRRALGIFGGVGLSSLLAACGITGEETTTGSASSSAMPSSTGTSTPATAGPTDSAAAEAIDEVNDETAGPFPGDGSNGVNVLDDSGIVRSDIRSSFGSSSTTAAGVPLQLRLTVRDAATGSALVGAAVYVWHCDREGNYSLYSSGVEEENYLRGVQSTDTTGTVTFTSIYPACYSGRWPHIHFEVYDDVNTAITNGPIVKTSQIALPDEANSLVYATSGYEGSAQNASRVTLSNDSVFGDDGGINQLATMAGSVSAGYVASLAVGV